MMHKVYLADWHQNGMQTREGAGNAPEAQTLGIRMQQQRGHVDNSRPAAQKSTLRNRRQNCKEELKRKGLVGGSLFPHKPNYEAARQIHKQGLPRDGERSVLVPGELPLCR